LFIPDLLTKNIPEICESIFWGFSVAKNWGGTASSGYIIKVITSPHR